MIKKIEDSDYLWRGGKGIKERQTQAKINVFVMFLFLRWVAD